MSPRPAKVETVEYPIQRLSSQQRVTFTGQRLPDQIRWALDRAKKEAEHDLAYHNMRAIRTPTARIWVEFVTDAVSDECPPVDIPEGHTSVWIQKLVAE